MSDAAHAGRFYRDVLGLQTRDGEDVVEVQVGASVLLLDQAAVQPGAYHCAINIPADRFDQAKIWLQSRVTPLGRDGQDEFNLAAPWNSQSVYFTGPDGIILELIARQDQPAASKGPFSSADLLRISEIGLAVPNVPAAVAQLKGALRLPLFGAAAADFTPLGDPDGLLIVVRRGRPWFPTDNVLPSEGPLAVTVDAGGRRSLRLMRDGTLDVA